MVARMMVAHLRERGKERKKERKRREGSASVSSSERSRLPVSFSLSQAALNHEKGKEGLPGKSRKDMNVLDDALEGPGREPSVETHRLEVSNLYVDVSEIRDLDGVEELVSGDSRGTFGRHEGEVGRCWGQVARRGWERRGVGFDVGEGDRRFDVGSCELRRRSRSGGKGCRSRG